MKKASLNLSINAIVVLIIAMVLMGLAIPFIQRMIGSAEESFEVYDQELKDQLIEDLRNEGGKLALRPTVIEMEPGDEKELGYILRNSLDTGESFVLEGTGKIDTTTNVGKWDETGSVIACWTATDDNADPSDITFDTSSAQYLDRGSDIFLYLKITVSSGAVPTPYTCSFIVADPTTSAPNIEQYVRKDFTVRVVE